MPPLFISLPLPPLHPPITPPVANIRLLLANHPICRSRFSLRVYSGTTHPMATRLAQRFPAEVDELLLHPLRTRRLGAEAEGKAWRAEVRFALDDVIGYEITSVSPFSLKECITRDGMLDDGFEDYLKRQTSLRLSNLDEAEFNTFFTRDWEHGVKRIFWGASGPPQFALSPPINTPKKRENMARILPWNTKDNKDYTITNYGVISLHPVAELSDFDSNVDQTQVDPSGQKDTPRIDWYLKKV
ncbi:hypothetical protein B0H67DRAFT_685615 [Lasiosphaeris hirsuta]|uniref:Uncharacterized protein n=1 Tax=Lasiosphaeris hirsuta TaxID=260670 RepID=A0AA40A0U8_9PEZI|nr:hypothetical protein B0H67DRAFT_685615 [Lasiosphaeris hirsuta]